MGPTVTGTVLARLSRTEALVEVDGRDRLVSTALVTGLRVGDRVVVGDEGVVEAIPARPAQPLGGELRIARSRPSDSRPGTR